VRRYGPVPDPEGDNRYSDDEYQSNNEDQVLDETDSDEDSEVDMEEIEDLEVDRVSVHMVDLAKKKVVQIKNLRDYAFFVGFNRSFMLHTRDFPNLIPNCVYVTDDNKTCVHYCPFNGRRFGYLNLEGDPLTELSFSDGLLHWPPPVWLRPQLS
jgi:hypothetical protein